MDGLIHLMHVPFSLAYLLERVENAIQYNDVIYTVSKNQLKNLLLKLSGYVLGAI